MKLIKNQELKDLNTFKVAVKAKYFVVIRSVSDAKNLRNEKPDVFKNNILVLGKGANILFTKDFDGLVIKNEIKGIKKISEDKKSITLAIGSGEDWPSFVDMAVSKNYGGVENLSSIPGTVGSAPIQNIAAYGQNIEDVFIELTALDLTTGKVEKFLKKDCDFGYRTSRFKNEKNKYLVLEVVLKLEKNPKNLNLSYFETGKTYKKGVSVLSVLEEMGRMPPYTLKDVSEAVTHIRGQKFPDIRKTGSAGSFFKNPIVKVSKYLEIKKEIPDLQWYPPEHLTYVDTSDKNLKGMEEVKIPGGKILDHLGWKGKKFGDVGVNENQAMVIVNLGNGTGKEILELSQKMKKDVYDHYGIKLEPEVIIL